jgi:hypothetical protein
MRQTMHRMLFTFLVGLLLSSCGNGLYSPRIREVTEEPIEGNYWYQKFTLYDPANRASDCMMSRTGQKLDLTSDKELAEIWRKFCLNYTDYDQNSNSSN